MDNKYDSKKQSEELANVLKYNPELLKEEKFKELALVFECRLLQAYNQGKAEAGDNQIKIVEVRQVLKTKDVLLN